MKTLTLNNYHFNRAIFLNEIKNIVLENGGRLVSKYSRKLEPIKIKNRMYEADEYITHYESYIGYELDGYYYDIEINDNRYFEHRYIKTKGLNNNMVHETFGDDTYLPMTYIGELLTEKTVDELKLLAHECIKELQESIETKTVVIQEAKSVPNTYNNGKHIEIVYNRPKYELKEITLL